MTTQKIRGILAVFSILTACSWGTEALAQQVSPMRKLSGTVIMEKGEIIEYTAQEQKDVAAAFVQEVPEFKIAPVSKQVNKIYDPKYSTVRRPNVTEYIFRDSDGDIIGIIRAIYDQTASVVRHQYVLVNGAETVVKDKSVQASAFHIEPGSVFAPPPPHTKNAEPGSVFAPPPPHTKNAEPGSVFAPPPPHTKNAEPTQTR